MQTNFASTEELARLSELIDFIYQGATEPSRWQSILPALTEWIGADSGLLHTPLKSPDEGGFYFMTDERLQPANLQLWWTRYRNEDIWAIRSIERGLVYEGNVIVGDDEVPFEELSRTGLYQDFLSKLDYAHLLSGIVFGFDAPQANPYVVCTLLRSLKNGRFTAVERDRLAILVPHLSRSLGVMTRLRDMELSVASSLAMLDRLNAGVLLFSVKGRVTFANRIAHRILEEEDGLRLQHCFGDSSLGQVIAFESQAHAALECAIRSVVSPDILNTEHFSRAVVISRPSGRQAYTLNFSSLAAQNEFGSATDAPRAIAFITDSAEPIKLDSELFRKTYGMTPAEIRLAEVLVECLTVEETAQRLGISRSTVKTQLQSIYIKTNTNNRAKLIKLIMSLAQLA